MLSPSLADLGESYFRKLTWPSADALVTRVPVTDWTTTAATAAVLTVGALGGIMVVAQAVVTGSVPVPLELGPALGAVPQAAVGIPTIAEVLPAGEHLTRGKQAVLSRGSAGDSLVSNPAFVDGRDEGAADYHEWQAPRLTDAPRSTGSDAERPKGDSGSAGQGDDSSRTRGVQVQRSRPRGSRPQGSVDGGRPGHGGRPGWGRGPGRGHAAPGMPGTTHPGGSSSGPPRCPAPWRG